MKTKFDKELLDYILKSKCIPGTWQRAYSRDNHRTEKVVAAAMVAAGILDSKLCYSEYIDTEYKGELKGLMKSGCSMKTYPNVKTENGDPMFWHILSTFGIRYCGSGHEDSCQASWLISDGTFSVEQLFCYHQVMVDFYNRYKD